MKIGYVVKDAHKWEVDQERTASEFDACYYRGLLEKAWEGRRLCSPRLPRVSIKHTTLEAQLEN
jgi:hypothetical protein